MLEVLGLTRAFGGNVAVQDVSFSVDAGELLALIGPNGAGKTTCFNCLNGQLKPDAGRIILDGRDIQGLPPRRVFRQGVGRTFQITRTFASMTVRENVQAALIASRRRTLDLLSRANDQFGAEADALLARVGIADQAGRACAVLAYGDLKRVELAVALVGEPKLLLMDEPTAGMAPRERVELMALAREIVRERNLAVLFTEHDMDVVFGHADRIMVMNRGEVVASGPPESIRRDPLVQEIYLGVETDGAASADG
ncbi:MAG TPA: ABC transporter ATP-binding protein [Geminicoccaceae bacterium]